MVEEKKPTGLMHQDVEVVVAASRIVRAGAKVVARFQAWIGQRRNNNKRRLGEPLCNARFSEIGGLKEFVK